MKVCFFSGDITRSGGTERVGSIIANELSKDNDYSVTFLSLWEQNKKPFFEINNKIKRYVLYDEPVSGKKHFFSYIKKIHEFVTENEIDILIDIDGILDMYSIPALKRTKTKLISWEHFGFCQNPDGNYRKFTRKLAAKRADSIVVLTKKDKEHYEKNLKVKCTIKSIHNPMTIQEKEITYDDGSKIIISAGRLSKDKGFDILIDVAKDVLEKKPDWKWLIAGEGEERELIEKKIKEYKLENKVILCGNVSNINDYYKKSALYVLTSRYEGFGLVLIEAKAYGLPCVSFDCPVGPAEIIKDEVNGYLIKCFDVEEMAKKICILIDNPKKRLEFSRHALDDTEKYSLDKVIKEWKELFGELYGR